MELLMIIKMITIDNYRFYTLTLSIGFKVTERSMIYRYICVYICVCITNVYIFVHICILNYMAIVCNLNLLVHTKLSN